MALQILKYLGGSFFQGGGQNTMALETFEYLEGGSLFHGGGVKIPWCLKLLNI